MILCCHSSLYYNYADNTDDHVLTKKGIFAAVTLGFTLIISIPTFIYLVNWKELIRLFILIDTIMVVTIAAALAFVNLMLLFDDDDDW
jgi:hypothetical protein